MWEKFKLSLARFMQGRYGSDALGRFLVWAALISYVLGLFIPYVGLLFSYLGLALLIYTIFRMFSMSKPVTACAAMILLERGQIDLLAPVEKYLPGFRDKGDGLGPEGGRRGKQDGIAA